MLQQTQVATVIDYYIRFMERFPNVAALAAADLDEVLHFWTGLGYYARGRNLHKAAKQVVERHGGEFPRTQDELESLPGIGRSTAGAIRAIAFEERAPILDGNVKRVLARFHQVDGYPGTTQTAKRLWQLAEEHSPHERTRQYTQAIMDLGATLCTRSPGCTTCPLSKKCGAWTAGAVADYPTPKPKKHKPLRRSRFFVVSTSNGATLLEQKPLDGLWGGLWSPPERPAETTSKDLLAELSIPADEVEREHTAPTFIHTFTHFRLEIEPIYIYLRAKPTIVADRVDQRWSFPHEIAENERFGLSRPAVKLLASLQEVFG